MDINKHIQYLEEKICDYHSYRDEALKKKNYNLATLSMRCAFMDNLELGLIRWRLGENPESHMHQALQGLLQDRETLLKCGAKSEEIYSLPFYCSVYVAALLNSPHPALDLNEFTETMVPGVFLGNVLMGADSIENWPQHQQKLPNKKRTALARATFDLYADMLLGKVTAEEGIKKGETFYKRRENDAHFQDSSAVFGGSHMNDRYVDFRLAAVLKHIGSTVPSLHAWRW